jgi:hypothetical protein
MLKKLRAWFNKDAQELAVEETSTMTPHERDAVAGDYEGHKDDLGGGGYVREPHTDFERDSERPKY